MTYLICDTECYINYFLIAFERYDDGKRIQFELRPGDKLPRDRIRKIMRQYTIVTFNGNNYDLPMIYRALDGADNAALKETSDRIILESVKWWDVERTLGITVPKIDHIDLFETNPSVRSGLKLINGRLHGRRMQDLPYSPSTVLTEDQIEKLRDYCVNGDIPATKLLFEVLKDALALRTALQKRFGTGDLRSKSDAQVGEAIIKHEIKRITGKPIYPNKTAIKNFKYEVPKFIKFDSPELNRLLDIIRSTTFHLGPSGKVVPPETFEGYKVSIGETEYSFGIGGVHTNEFMRAIHSDHNAVLVDVDVTSQYPSILIKLKKYPAACGRTFVPVYSGLKALRVEAKKRGDKHLDQGGKIALNGAYGKTSSIYSVLYGPDLTMATTLTGQLSILMLAEMAHKRGIPVASANTDGVTFLCPWDKLPALREVIRQWEGATSFDLETNLYQSIHSANVNNYIAFDIYGKDKRKGAMLANPWHTPEGKPPDYYSMMKKNPQMTVCSDAVTAFIKDGKPIEDSIRECNDVRRMITVVQVTGGALWTGGLLTNVGDVGAARDEWFIGKVVRYYWSKDGAPIYRKKPHAKTGNYAKVGKTDGCMPLMQLPDDNAIPDDLDRDRYIAECAKILYEIGYRPGKVYSDVERVILGIM